MANKPKVRIHPFLNSNLTATMSISLMLFLVGLVTILSLLANDLSVFVKENINFSIMLDDGTTEA